MGFVLGVVRSSGGFCLGVGSVLWWVLFGGWFGPPVGFARGWFGPPVGFCFGGWFGPPVGFAGGWFGPLECGAKKPVGNQQAFGGLF